MVNVLPWKNSHPPQPDNCGLYQKGSQGLLHGDPEIMMEYSRRYNKFPFHIYDRKTLRSVKCYDPIMLQIVISPINSVIARFLRVNNTHA